MTNLWAGLSGPFLFPDHFGTISLKEIAAKVLYMNLYSTKVVFQGKEFSVDFKILNQVTKQLCLITAISPDFDNVKPPYYYSRAGAPSVVSPGSEEFHIHVFESIVDLLPLEE